MRHTCAVLAKETFCKEGVGSNHDRLKAADEKFYLMILDSLMLYQ